LSNQNTSQENDIIFYTTSDGAVHIEVFFQDETFWLTMNRMAELFGTSKQSISYHLQNIYNENELQREATVKEILTVQNEGGREVSRMIEYYNPDAFLQFNEYDILKDATLFILNFYQTI
jgi:hypothetical protein